MYIVRMYNNKYVNYLKNIIINKKNNIEVI